MKPESLTWEHDLPVPLLLLLLSRFSRVRLSATPETAAHQAPPPMGFSRRERWRGGHCLLSDLFLYNNLPWPALFVCFTAHSRYKCMGFSSHRLTVLQPYRHQLDVLQFNSAQTLITGVHIKSYKLRTQSHSVLVIRSQKIQTHLLQHFFIKERKKRNTAEMSINPAVNKVGMLI